MFEIQILEKEIIQKYDNRDIDLCEALQTIYSYEDFFILKWNKVDIKLGYNGVLSDIIGDLKRLYIWMNAKDEGEYLHSFGSSSFMAYWEFKSIDTLYEIKSSWTAVRAKNDLLNSEDNRTIRVDKNKFKAEWKKVANAVKEDLLLAGYGQHVLSDFDFLNILSNENLV